MRYKRWLLCMAAMMFLLCGCARTKPSEDIPKDIPKDIPIITVIDTLPAVDESIPREPVELPSSEIINIMEREEDSLRIRQKGGSFSYEQFTVYNVIFHDHDVFFAMPNDGQINWEDAGVSVQYIGEREFEMLKKLNEKNVVGEDCEAFNEGMAKTRQLIKDGFLQDAFTDYLSDFPELDLEGKSLTLELTCAERTDRKADQTSWWELDYDLIAESEDGVRLTLATMDISKVFLVQGEENTWDDAQYRIWGYPSAMWELLEQPEEDRGETALKVLPEGTFTDEASIYDYMEQYAGERQITWTYSGKNSFWYDYLLWEGEGGGYQYRIAIPITDKDAGSWIIQAKIKTGAENPNDCFNALSVFMQTFRPNKHSNP